MKRIYSVGELGLTAKSRVLFVMPHPDDEAVYAGGLIAKLNASSVPSRLITMTRGEKSTLRFGISDTDDLGKVRTVEVFTAVGLLGCQDSIVYEIGDGSIEKQEKETGAILGKEMSRYKPTHLVTLEPDGIYGHPDHIALSRLVSVLCASSSIQLIYVTACPGFTPPRSSSKMARKKISPIAPDFELALNAGETLKKVRAVAAHKTQFRFNLSQWETTLGFIRYRTMTREYYAYAPK